MDELTWALRRKHMVGFDNHLNSSACRHAKMLLVSASDLPGTGHGTASSIPAGAGADLSDSLGGLLGRRLGFARRMRAAGLER